MLPRLKYNVDSLGMYTLAAMSTAMPPSLSPRGKNKDDPEGLRTLSIKVQTTEEEKNQKKAKFAHTYESNSHCETFSKFVFFERGVPLSPLTLLI